MDYGELFRELQDTPLSHWSNVLPARVQAALDPGRHGRITEWQAMIHNLPPLTPSSLDLDAPAVRIGMPQDVDEARRAELERHLRGLHPWRKGPFEVFGIRIDAEWRSDRKWDRLAPHIDSLDGRLVLDVGCGNGYHCWRMAGRGAGRVIGIDPVTLYVMQFRALQHFAAVPRLDVLPLGLEALPASRAFDSVFSMGVLYHRRSPFDHLLQLHAQLRGGGQLVLETLVVEGEAGYSLLPADRYARMRNVWLIPSLPTLKSWLERCGFAGIRCVDVARTTPGEQRSSSWMRFESLAEALDAEHPGRTVEGLQAPTRAVVLSEAV